MRRLPDEVQRYEHSWHGEHDPRHTPIVVPAGVLRQPEEDVDVFIGTPCRKEGSHPGARVQMLLIVPVLDVTATLRRWEGVLT